MNADEHFWTIRVFRVYPRPNNKRRLCYSKMQTQVAIPEYGILCYNNLILSQRVKFIRRLVWIISGRRGE
jgi:hypothetical protein